MSTNNYRDVGQIILEQQHQTDGVILPPIFYHQYIEDPQNSKNERYKENVKGAEQELIVFNALKRLLKEKPYLIVLHNFKFNKEKLSKLGVSDSKIEEILDIPNPEHDFIVIDKEYQRFFSIEVKSSENSNFAKQVNRIGRLIDNVWPGFNIIKIAAFPSVEKDKKNNAEKYIRLYKKNVCPPIALLKRWNEIEESLRNEREQQNDAEKTNQGNRRHLEEKQEHNHENSNLINENPFDNVTKELVGLWASGKKDFNFSEVGMITHIDDRLKKNILYQSDNPKKIMTDNVKVNLDKFFASLNIKSLTEEQHELFYDTTASKKCLIRGPAGSGKTILMLAKIYELINGEEKKPVVIISHVDNNEHCAITEVVKTIRNWEIKNSKVKISVFQFLELGIESDIPWGFPFHDEVHYLKETITIGNYEKIDESREKSEYVKIRKYWDYKDDAQYEGIRVYEDIRSYDVLIMCPSVDNNLQLFNIFDIFQNNVHLFVDNLQHRHFLDINLETALIDLKDHTDLMWLMCDEMQYYNYKWKHDSNAKHEVHMQIQSLNDFEEKILKNIVRNTFEIAEASTAMRGQAIIRNSLEIEPVECKTFHLIHGPMPILKIKRAYDASEIIFNKINQFVKRYEVESLALLTNLQYYRFNIIDNISPGEDWIFRGFVFDAMPHEFTAVLGILDLNSVETNDHEARKQWFSSYSHLILSRARVVAEIILITDNMIEVTSFKEENRMLFNIEVVE